MICEQARPLISASADEDLDREQRVAVDAHLETCERCAGFRQQIGSLRRELRFEPVGDVPDLASAVVARIAGTTTRRPDRTRAPLPASRRARRWAPVSIRPFGGRWAPAWALFVAGAVAGAAFVGLSVRRPPSVAAADIAERVVAAQSSLESLTAEMTVVERGWHPAVGERRYQGTLSYRAPERLSLELTDMTRYPDGPWAPNDLTLVTNAGRAWRRGLVACPVVLQPACGDGNPRVEAVVGREPFPENTIAPLDLVLPVRSFDLGGDGQRLGQRTIAGRPALGVVVTVAQAAPVLDGLRAAGNWRELYPGDRVELWLDQASMVPLALRVYPAYDSDRSLWASRRGYDDRVDVPVLEFQLHDVQVNEPLPHAAFPPAPAAADVRDAGFEDTTVARITPGWIPDGLIAHRSGWLDTRSGPRVLVRSWSDGRAWLKIEATRQWAGQWLYGDLGPVVRPVQADGGAVVYLGAGGSRVGVHGQDWDILVTGSLPSPQLVRVAESLDVRGGPTPPGWKQSSSLTLEAAASSFDGLLVPAALDGFGEPAVRADADSVTLVYAGSGARGFVLTQASADQLTPPFDGDVRGVTVRSVIGRYTLALGELEWVEDGRIISLRSETLQLPELVTIAEGLAAR